MIYPEAIEVNGIEYEINTGYEHAIACFSCMNDPDISDTERALGVVSLLYLEEPPDLNETIRLALKYLLRGSAQKQDDDGDDDDEPRRQDMDYVIDMHYIRSSFRSDYHINLSERSDMHWWEFSELLQGLTDDCILNRIRDLRNYDLTTISDGKSRMKMARAQRDVALPQLRSAEEEARIKAFYDQLK